ncbi:unnamed protein product [Linum tenue]|uniref:RRM domain-containing protein n=1 Tax=Linum tenue TaxID=586396 RepID=A0AAV0ITV5_9ROSI|nr:unnamed protein product [Linum tenue]
MAAPAASPYPSPFSTTRRVQKPSTTFAVCGPAIHLKNAELRFPSIRCRHPGIGRQRCSSACLPSSSSPPKTRLFVSGHVGRFHTGLSFRTTEESLRNAFQNFGQLVEVNLVMDKIARRPKGFTCMSMRRVSLVFYLY